MNHSKTGVPLASTTRLSASAKPFTLNRSTHQSSSNFSVHSGQEPSIYSLDHCSSDPFSSLLDSFPKFNLGAKGNSVVSARLGDYALAHEATATTFPIDTASHTQTQEESFLQQPSVEFQGTGDFVVPNGSDYDMFKEFSLPVHCSNITGLGYGTRDGNELNYGKQGKDYHESLFVKGNDVGSAGADGNILQKGKHDIGGLNLCQEASDGIFRKGTDSILANENLSNSGGTMQTCATSSSVLTSNCEDAPLVFSTSDMSSAAKLNSTPQNQCCYTPSVVTYSNFVSSGASDGQYFSQVPSCLSNAVFDTMGNHSAVIHGSSSACSVLLPFDSSRNMDFFTGSCGTIDGKDCSSSSLPGTKNSFVMLNADGKSSMDVWKQKKIGKSVSFDATDYLTNIPDEVTLKSHGTNLGVSIKNSSKSLGDSDSDLDSPCWKGTMTSSQSPREDSGSVHSQYFEKELQKCNSLNPLAPQFFPGNAEGSSCLGSKNVKDDFVSSKSSTPIAINLLSGVDWQIKTMAEAYTIELKKGVELLHSNDMYEREKAINLVNNSTCMVQPGPIEDCSTVKRTVVTAMDVEGCVKETKDAMATESIRGSFPTNCHPPTPTLSSSQAGVVTDLIKTLQGVSKSIIDSPKLDVQIMVNAMYNLSELLVQTCAHGLDSCKEHDHDIVQHIINNLNVFSTSYSGQRIPTLQPTHGGYPYFLGRSPELPQHSNKGVEVASIETFAIPKKHYHQNDNLGQNSVSKVIAERGQYSLSSSSDLGTEKGNEIVKVIRRNLGKSQDVEEQMHPQALLYKNLWLDAEAALCYMRRKIYLKLMETGMDVNRTDFLDLWR